MSVWFLQIESESELYALCADVYPTFMYPSLSGEEIELIPGGRNTPVRYSWATSRENVSSGIFHQVHSNQPAQLQKLARILKLWIKQVQMSYYLNSEQQRCWSDCADAQADLHLCCSHMV